jgi:beta-galactosidase
MSMKSALGCLFLLCLPSLLTAQPYVPPASHRADLSLDAAWRFIRQDVAGAQAPAFDDSSWSVVNLPHTWNNLDGQDGGNNYYRGVGWYRLHYTVSNSYAGRRLFLKFDGAFLVTDVYVNGSLLGEHQGGFAAFTYDATPLLNVGADNVIAVKVSNASNTNIPPLSADFTFFGGIYRDVHLLVTDPVQISPLDYASSGVYLKPSNVSASSANLQVTTVLSNATVAPSTVTVRAVITDAATNFVAAITNVVTLAAGSLSNVVGNTALANPRLWNGLEDPYLYQAFVEVWNGPTALDVVAQPLGFRYFSMDPANGFSLNGRPYDLHGVNMHQDWLNCGWALNSAQRATNFLFLKELGATAVRLSHYEHHEETYELADQNGIVLWSEVPNINYITASPAYYSNTLQQLKELIRQRYNHPSVVCWGLFNEVTLASGPDPSPLISQEAQLVAQEDSTRPTTAAANSSNNDPTTQFSQWIGFNRYYGWYGGVVSDLGSWADSFHSTYPTRMLAISEYGCGASVLQHSEDPVAEPANAGHYHPEEYQNLFHESYWQQMKARPFVWGKYIWSLFDFAADGRNEGDTPGRNDKGLVTYDRQVRKDAFYWYKANWTTSPMVYITGHTFTNRQANAITAKVYANCDSVELLLNGVSQGARASTNCIFAWPLTLLRGTNAVQAVGTKGATLVRDSLIWIAPTPPPSAAITSPAAGLVYLNSTNDTLQLAATATDTQPSPPPLTTTWGQASGPGSVVFGDASALSTTARFSAEGLYSLLFTASNGATNSLRLLVVVNPGTEVRDGLLAWWKMDEAAGNTATDASGNNLPASVSGAAFTTGHLSNALHFNGSSDAATFASPDTGQITLAAWVRAEGRGNSQYPRILDTPGYRLFFRFDGQGTNALDFATYSTANGDWISGPNTISTGAWYHVAASYDRSNFANQPALYVNGVKLAPQTITSPSGTQPPYSGTGYIGNKTGLSRAWNGFIDDLRIYNRLLSDAEVALLASMPPANVAPVVKAGTNQAVLWPGPVNLGGTLTDDGNPNPPGAVRLTWSQVAGPGTVSFLNPNAATTTATFSTGGSYQLQLLADDGDVTTADSVLVTAIIRPTLLCTLSGSLLTLSWLTNGGSWRLQAQTNGPSVGLGTDWVDVPGLVSTSCLEHIDPRVGSIFHRVVGTIP